ncbi:hypothetical protein [Tunicatimonas pelagia]|uniref:hypothetical protein n=1 Tax=Tunicatimonas pelagia TaxID=931531 RepID=UPI0026664EEF|nr:hypothetical protein [Tunicatimonas pelagia]WKN43942.1 hypothetical protein P0M28_03020 [Tunicatimonas pelagia]
MKIDVLRARVRRNKLEKLAGESYRDEKSQLIKSLHNEDKKALLGIQKGDGIYTVLGEECVYYSSNSGIERKISYGRFTEILRSNALKTGKTTEFEFLNITEQDCIWILNTRTMNAIWNTVLLLQKWKE